MKYSTKKEGPPVRVTVIPVALWVITWQNDRQNELWVVREHYGMTLAVSLHKSPFIADLFFLA